MSPGPKEFSQIASFPEVCIVCVFQVKTNTCAEISERFWRLLILSSTTLEFSFGNNTFFPIIFLRL